jgi:ABC-2 type transport system ATP-binding protein
VILDEPFSGLDPVSADSLRETILELKRAGTTIVFSTHDMSSAERLCDAVMMIHDGKKVLDGTVDEVKRGRSADTVRVVFTGASPLLSDLDGVASTKEYGREHSLLLKEGYDPQLVLEQLMRRGRVQKFEVARPSLHELFVSIAGESRRNESEEGAHV